MRGHTENIKIRSSEIFQKYLKLTSYRFRFCSENPRIFSMLINVVEQERLSKKVISHFAKKCNVDKLISMEGLNER